METGLIRHPQRRLARWLLAIAAVELVLALTFLYLLLPVDVSVAPGAWVYWRAVGIVAGAWLATAGLFGGWRVALIAFGSRRWRGDVGWLCLFGLLVVGYPALTTMAAAARMLVGG